MQNVLEVEELWILLGASTGAAATRAKEAFARL
jgi:hypothetical protein